MKKTIDRLTRILEHNNISLPQGVEMSEAGNPTNEHERLHPLKAGFTQSKAYLIDSGACNHMVSSKSSFTCLDLFGESSIHMGFDSKILAIGKGSIKFEHGEFKNVLYVPSLAINLFFVYQMTHTTSPKRVTFDSDTVEISEVSTRNMIVKGISNHSSKEYDFSHFLPNSYPSALLIHANNKSKLCHEIFSHLNFNYIQQLHK